MAEDRPLQDGLYHRESTDHVDQQEHHAEHGGSAENLRRSGNAGLLL